VSSCYPATAPYGKLLSLFLLCVIDDPTVTQMVLERQGAEGHVRWMEAHFSFHGLSCEVLLFAHDYI